MKKTNHPKRQNVRYTPKDLDLSQLQSPPYKIAYIKSNSPTAVDLSPHNVTRSGQNLTKTDYAKLLDKHYGKNR